MLGFSIRKVLQALYYIQKGSGKGYQPYMYFVKMMYFADRHHVRHYGITISDDHYVAIKMGPVASATLDILKRQMPKIANRADYDLLNEVQNIDEYNVLIKKQLEDELSLSNKKSLDFAIGEFGNLDQYKLSDISHDYPEWVKHKEEIQYGMNNGGEKLSFSIPLEDFFENPKNLPNFFKIRGTSEDPYFEEDKDFLKAMKESVHEATC